MTMFLTGLMNSASGSTDPFSLAYVASVQNSTTGTSFTFSGASIGATSSTRYVLVAVSARGGGSTVAFSGSQTIGGNTATVIGQTTGSTAFAGQFILLVTGGTTANIVVNFNVSTTWCVIHVYRLVSPTAGVTPLASHPATGTGTLSSASMTTAVGGGAVANSTDNRSSGATTFTNLTSNYDATFDGDHASAGSNTSTSGSATTFSLTTGSGATVGAAFFTTWSP